MEIRSYYSTFWTDLSSPRSSNYHSSRRAYASPPSPREGSDFTDVKSSRSVLKSIRTHVPKLETIAESGSWPFAQGQTHIKTPSSQTIVNQLSAFCGIPPARISFDVLPRWIVSDTYKCIFPFNEGKSIIRCYETQNTSPQGFKRGSRIKFLKSFAFTDMLMNSGCHVVQLRSVRSLRNNIVIGVSSYEAMLLLDTIPFNNNTFYAQSDKFLGFSLQSGEMLVGEKVVPCLPPIAEGASIFLAVDADNHNLWVSTNGIAFTLAASNIPSNLLFFVQLFNEGDEVTIGTIT